MTGRGRPDKVDRPMTTGRGRWRREDAEEMRGRPDNDDRMMTTGQGCRGDERMNGRGRWRHKDGDDGVTRMERMASRGWRGEERTTGK